MSTQFFERQDKARTNTLWLVFLFSAAVIGLIGTSSITGYVLGVMARDQGPENMGGPGGTSPLFLAFIFGGVSAAIILFGSLYQILTLRLGGGSSVAESLGGRQILGTTQDLNEKRLLNVVEEMAIASGTPVPPVYLLEESSINAFAAGYLPGDAVVGVTRGAMESLNREELQGVIAHEFSHILNGDMRINIRMIGILHGILLLSFIGQMLFRSLRYSHMGNSRSDNDKGKGGVILLILVAGVTMIVIGWFGSFIGGLIKAAVSRQREHLADASAVQFTRNPSGLANALKQIGARSNHGLIEHPNAGIASHMYFAQGVFEGLSGLLATHPPLETRIRALEPNWNGVLPVRRTPSGNARGVESLYGRPAGNANQAAAAGVSSLAGGAPPSPHSSDAPLRAAQANEEEIPLPIVMAAADQIGAPELAHRQYVAALMQEIDPALKDAAHETYSARALVFALLLSEDYSERKKQLIALSSTITQDIVLLTVELWKKTKDVPDAAKLPLVDLSLPMLRMMSPTQYNDFIRAFTALCEADNRLSIFEWTLAQVLMRHLKRNFAPIESTTTLYFRLDGLEQELSLLFSILARVGHESGGEQSAMRVANEHFPNLSLHLLPAKECSLQNLEHVLSKLARAHPKRRGEILNACAAAVCDDGLVLIREAELLRGVSDLLDCPMPPLVGRIQETQ